MIRPATRDDLETILSLIHDLAVYEKEPDAVVLDRDTFVRHLFDEQAAHVLIAVDDETNQVAGMALYFFNFSTWLGRRGLYLEDLFVRPEFRGRGHGKALLGALAKVAVEKECGRLEWSVLDWNEPAIGFYRSIGAIPMDGWTVYRLTGDPLRELAGSLD